MISYVFKVSNFILVPLIFILFYFILLGPFKSSKTNITIANKNLSNEFIDLIPSDPKLIKNYLTSQGFIKYFNVQVGKENLIIDIIIKKPIAKNINTNQIIFENNLIIQSNYFEEDFINKIKLIDITSKTLLIDSEFLNKLRNIKFFNKFTKIEFIDNRRYDLYLNDERKLMLPKVVDDEIINFLNDQYEIFINNNKFNNYMDLRNFYSDSIRMQ